MADHQPEVVGRDLDQIALLNVPGAAQPGAAQAADVEDEGETALDLLGAQLESLAGDCALQPRPVVVDGPASRVVAVPLTAGNGHAGDRQSCGDLWPEEDVVSEVVEAADEVDRGALGCLLVEERLSELLEGHGPGEHVEHRHQDPVRDGHGRP